MISDFPFWNVKSTALAKQLTITVQRIVLFSLFMLGMPSLASAQSISIGPFGQGIISGTVPFNTTGVCTEPGDDCGATDTRIRSNDLQTHFYSIIVSGISSGSPDVNAVVFEQTIMSSDGAVVEFESIPPVCLAPPAGTGGTDPLSSIVQNADGSTTLICNIGSMGNGEQKSLTFGLVPSPESADGSTFTSSVNAYGLDASGNKIIADTPYSDGATYEVSVAPAWDLIGDRIEIFNAFVASEDLGTGRGLEPGYVLYTTALLGADASSRGKGTSALMDNFSFDLGITATGSDGVTEHPLEVGVLNCNQNVVNWSKTVFGSEELRSERPIEQKVVDSGACTWTGDPVSGYTMNVAGAKTDVRRFPTETVGGTSLVDGPYYVAAFRVVFFIPFSEIEREDPITNSGSINVTQCLNNFDPVDGKNISNYGLGFEPGYNGAAMPDGSASNNCSGPVPVELKLEAGYNYRTISSYHANDEWDHGPYVTAFHTGDGVVEPTVAYAYLNFLRNDGSVAWTNPMQCGIFDNSTQKLTDRSNIGHTEGEYAFGSFRSGAVESDWEIEYASVNLSNLNPLDGNQDGSLDLNSASGRYEGTWDDFANFRCDTPGVVWNTDADAIGIDDVNAVRLVPKDPSLTQFDSGENIWFVIPVEARSNFYGGPYAGAPIPSGTVLASHGGYRSDELEPDGIEPDYQPSPENDSVLGDRMTISGSIIRVVQHTLAGADHIEMGVRNAAFFRHY